MSKPQPPIRSCEELAPDADNEEKYQNEVEMRDIVFDIVRDWFLEHDGRCPDRLDSEHILDKVLVTPFLEIGIRHWSTLGVIQIVTPTVEAQCERLWIEGRRRRRQVSEIAVEGYYKWNPARYEFAISAWYCGAHRYTPAKEGN